MRIFSFALATTGGLLPTVASAHEVYVLPPDVVRTAVATPSFSEIQVALSNINLFVFWAFIAVLVIFIVFFVSISRTLESWLDPWLAKLPPYAPAISRVTIGLSLLAASYNAALFGPELPLSGTFGPYATLVALILAICGCLLVIGMYTRVAALAGLILFVIEAAQHGSYLLTYTNYLGELLILLVLGAHTVAVHHRGYDARRLPRALLRLKEQLMPCTFAFLRVAFGISLIYASLYAKVIHNNLALDVTVAYPSLVAFFGFEPHFLVLGAAIIELLIGTFFILGIEIRFTALFVLFWLSLSLSYFGEAVWPHIVLIGIPVAFIFYGYDKYSLEGRFFKRRGREPVL
ncbi:MAG: hypothetical protein V4480_00460 [Patescibacteria group bacterium]